MKRIPVVGLLSLGMLAFAPAKADHYDYSGQGTTMRPDTRGYDHQRFMGHGQEGDYSQPYYGSGTKMRPDGGGYDHQRFEGGFEDRTTGGKWIGERRRRGPFFSYAGRESYRRGTYRTNARGMKGEGRSGWLGRGSAYNGPGMGGQGEGASY